MLRGERQTTIRRTLAPQLIAFARRSSLASLSRAARRQANIVMSSGNTSTFQQLDAEAQQLIREAIKAREFSYSPYSGFKVGAAVRCADGTLRSGCNVENVSFGMSICAERCAIVKAVSENHLNFVALSVVAEKIEGRLTTPCGACRQMLREFGDFPVYVTCPDQSQVLLTSCSDLLPHAFQPSDRLFSSESCNSAK
ncbi:cytidine deaminase-like [Phymastichus coffea]|uniref:cytidine deaminase-like n=1 Tax=Phymastichus coffea TaxID=108790 RepID=UPI00273C8E41|nr:cytidine deaminase-like [Phymastichus coffea]